MTTIALFAGPLGYPDTHLTRQCERLQEQLTGEHPEAAAELLRFTQAMKELTLSAQCELYTRTFDLMAVCSPYAGIHLYGEDNYKRGGLMARLKEVFALHGLEIGNELPDHLTVLLRYCAIAPADEALEVCEFLLRAPVESMVTILSKTQNPYAHLLSALRSVLAAPASVAREERAGLENV